MFLRQNAENMVCVLIMMLHLSLPNLTWGKIIPGKLVVLGKVAGKKSGKSVVFCQTRGGGAGEGVGFMPLCVGSEGLLGVEWSG